ncbi:DUF2726 domain-containing protein [Shewanella sp. 1_MG-2023]|uniref:DUF2726 domain-containing protein n=1 Tax=unclassified Shewanella TaxID=196818 RepID=UPI0026E48B40|nr:MULTISPECIES: DUF2726 domain-containing protein [unclassified Shewanella]MDO6611396.1 DUF2726 domain-containing protein [Shewanella sp. 7_MG-2023]MDO6771251.1 DUF2726 domain-containing protein [Shewanella sp. 2_MG-2023]MDO6795492.1 DUF2726 domain-containing protein [Shewanella sp. 1_MG-2023]
MDFTYLILAFVFIVLIRLFIAFISRPQQLNYRRKTKLFSHAERSFLGVLDTACADQYRVFAKVRVADVLTPEKGLNRSNWQTAFNRISAKHFDYILCKPDTMEFVAAIELDDKSHNSKQAQKRDALINEACESAQLPLIRFPAKARYSVQEVKQVIEQTITPEIKGSL